MKVFDLHADIGYNVMQKRKHGERDILKKYHVCKLQDGGFSWVCMASYFEGNENWEDMQNMILTLKEEIASCSGVELSTSATQLKKDGCIHAILSVEGMCGINDDVISKIDWLYKQGVKIASLTWNDENALATGARGTKDRGLTELGRIAVQRMEKHRMIIDVSHANETTFWDIMKSTDAMVIATHSNAYALCEHVRNLKDEQLIEIAKRGGIVGVVTAGFFVNRERNSQDIAHLISHIQYLKTLIGIDHIALGLDFMDDFENSENDMLTDLASPRDTQRIIEGLRLQGFEEGEIRKIAYENALSLISKYM